MLSAAQQAACVALAATACVLLQLPGWKRREAPRHGACPQLNTRRGV
jgi:hypothetical protein